MNQQEIALAYGRGYQLFSEIVLRGVTDEMLALLPDLDVEADAHHGAAHYHLFVHNVYPYETIFLGEDGLLGGTVTERVSAFYGRIGFQASSDADHLGTELAALAFLSFAEQDAAEDGIPHEVQRLRQLQRRFLDDHLLRWLPVFVLAVEQQATTVYTALVRQCFELACSHRAALGEDLMATAHLFSLPPVPDLLDNEKTSLRDIARYLLTPAHTGFFISSDDIKRIGADFRVPHGFGKRQQILTNLLRTASDYDLFPEIMATFKQMARDWQAQLTAMPLLPVDSRQVWLQRLDHTREVLTTIEMLAREQQFVLDDDAAQALFAQGQPSAGCAVEKDGTDDRSC